MLAVFRAQCHSSMVWRLGMFVAAFATGWIRRVEAPVKVKDRYFSFGHVWFWGLYFWSVALNDASFTL